MEKAVAIAVLVALASVGLSSGTVYKVGDKDGWTTVNVNYTDWASKKSFQIGDVILFVYNNNFHDVMLVSQDDYVRCSTGSPLALYNSGNDSITLNNTGNHYFLCGTPGHCKVGQKVSILVHGSSGGAPPPSPVVAPSPSSSSSPPSTGVPPSPAVAPTHSGASATVPSKIVGLVLTVLPFAATFGGLTMMPW